MPLYRYEALDRTGNTVVGAMNVASEQALAARLQSMGYHPTTIQVAQRSLRQTAAAPAPQSAAFAPGARLSASDRSVARMLHQLHISFRAGLPAYQALTTVSGQVAEPVLGRCLREVAQAVEQGATLSEALERYPRLFSPGDVGTIRAAEQGGFLPEAFETLAAQREQDDNARRRLAVWTWMFHLNMFLFFLLLPLPLAIRPALETMDFGVGARAASRGFMLISLPLVALYAGGIFLAQYANREPALRRWWHGMLLRFPPAREIHGLRAKAVFTRTLERLYHAGTLAATAWDTAAAAVPNMALAERFAAAGAVVKDTGRLSAGIQHVEIMEPADAGMVATGETAGDVERALHHLANRYEEDTRVAQGAGVVRAAIRLTAWGFILTALAELMLFGAYLRDVFPAINKFMGVDE